MKWTSAAVNGIRPLSARACSAGVSGADLPDAPTLVSADWTALEHPAAKASTPATATDRGDFLMIRPPFLLAFRSSTMRTYARPLALGRSSNPRWRLRQSAGPNGVTSRSERA